jgi:putative ABC transport system permease protein
MTRRKRMLEDLDQDLRDHIDCETEDNIARGMTPQEARSAALRKFGNLTRVKEETWEVWSVVWLEQLLEDVRFGLRMLRKNPGVTAAVALTLALGIGANTYIFSQVDALVLRPFEFPNPDRTVALWERLPASGVDRNEPAPANFLDWKDQNHVFDHIAAQNWWDASLGGVDHPEHLHGFLVTPDYFAALDAQPMLGRMFLPEESTPGRDHAAMLSYGLWRDRFGADPSIVGKPVLLNGMEYTVAGVMGPKFNYPSGTQVWGALAFTPEQTTDRNAHYLHSVAHLASGVSLSQAQAEMSAIAMRIEQQYPQTNTGRDVHVMPLVESEVGQTRAPLVVLLVAVGVVLLIACANISNLMLARVSRRQREMAVRVALGATRMRLIRQSMVESVLLGLLGGGLGVLLALLCLKVQVIRIPPEFARMVPGWDKVAINTLVLLFTSAISLATGLVFGFLPALRASRPDVNHSLKESALSAGSGRRRGLLRKGLIVSEVGLSVLLLTVAGLMMQTFVRLGRVSPGFNPDRLLTMLITLPDSKYATDQQTAGFFEQLVEQVRALPGVKDAAAADMIPFGLANHTASMRIEGQPEPKPSEEPGANYRSVSNSYFRTMQIPILRGREFTSQDSDKGQPVIAVNQAFAKRYWPGENAVGKRMRLSGPLESHPWRTVVAVVGDIRNHPDLPADEEMYFPLRQQTERSMAVVVRTSTNPRSLENGVRARVAALDRDLPVFDVMTMDQLRSVSITAQRIGGTLMTVFAGLALVLAATGLFSVIACAVSDRTHEIGIRIALGARPREVGRLMVGQGMMLAAVGLLIGLPLALAMGRAISGLLYGVSPNDFVTFAGVGAILLGVSFAACYIPARRAMRVDPTVALKYQ